MRSTTFFKLNRIFLLAGLIISFIIPAISYKYDVLAVSESTVTPVNQELLRESPTFSKVSQLEVDYSDEVPVVTTKAKNTIMIRLGTVWMVLFILYALVVALLVIREFVAHSRLLKMLRTGKRTKFEGYTVIDTPLADTPFTAFKVIFADMSKISDDNAKLSILKHEIAHISQKHWFDLILAELGLIAQWFNPVMWAYVRNLKTNHEYLADKDVLDQGISLSEYRAALINERFQGDVFNMSNSFKGGSSLGRLAMMKKEKTSAWRKVLSLAIFPLLGIFLWLSAEPNFILLDLDHLSVKVIGKITTVDEDGYPVQNGMSVKDVMLITQLSSYESVIPSSLRTKKVDLYSKLGTNGTLVVKTRKNSKGINSTMLIERIKDLKDVVILIDGSAASIDDLLAFPQQEIASISYLYNNRMISQEGSLLTVSLLSGYGVSGPKLMKTDNLDVAISDADQIVSKLNNPLIMINGRRASTDELRKIKTNNINVMSVFTQPKNTSRYGDRGKGGVITITTDVPS